jgi:hypothetical protein
VLAVVRTTQSGVDDTSIGLSPDLVLSQMGGKLCEIEGSVDFLIGDVPFDFGKLLNESLAGAVKVLTGSHMLSVLRSAIQL